MPRANRRRRDDSRPLGDLAGALTATEYFAGAPWSVRRLPGREPERRYWCPGCAQEFSGGLAHVVAWPQEGVGGVGDRRHWHTGCWVARERRRPPGATR